MYPNINAERARNGLSVEQLSNMLGITRRTFYNWVTKGRIPQKQLEKMAELFGVSIDYLLMPDSAKKRDRPA